MGRSDHRRASPPGRALWALWFVVLALVALTAVPAFLDGRLAELQSEITDVLEPAGSLSSRLSLLKARQIARLEGFVLTGDRSFREPYMAGVAEEDSVFSTLTALVRDLRIDAPEEFEIRERLAELSAQSARWHFENQQVFDLDEDPTARALAGVRIRDGYEQLVRATRDLDRAIQGEVQAGRRRMARVRVLRGRITLGLALLALGATFVVGRVGSGLRELTGEAERRRRDAVRARREIDALLEATGDGVLGIDLEGRCTSLNRAGVELLGYTPREIKGRDLHDTIYHSYPSGSPRAREDSSLLLALQRGEAADSEDGEVLWRQRRVPFPARWSLRPLVDGVELRGAVLTFTDMTEIRGKEEALRKAIRQREDVVSIVSHDLRNPLGVVFGATDILLELPLDEQQRRQQAQIIARAAGRMKSLIDDLLDLARIEAGAFVMRRSLEDLHEIMEEASDIFRSQADARNVRLVLGTDASRPGGTMARVDRDRILQALANLLDNALRFTPEGGRVTLAARDEGAVVSLSVSDTGPGIEPQKIQHLFDRFWRTEEGMGGAAGLGLAIVKGVAEAHGGVATVESVVGRGTTFTIRLPGRVEDRP